MGRERTLVQRDLISAQIAEQTSLINPRSFADRPLPSRPERDLSTRGDGIPLACKHFFPSFLHIDPRFSIIPYHFISRLVYRLDPFLLLAISARMGAAAERRHRHARWNFEGRNSSRNSRDGSPPPPPPPTPTKYSIPPRRGLWVIDILSVASRTPSLRPRS